MSDPDAAVVAGSSSPAPAPRPSLPGPTSANWRPATPSALRRFLERARKSSGKSSVAPSRWSQRSTGSPWEEDVSSPWPATSELPRRMPIRPTGGEARHYPRLWRDSALSAAGWRRTCARTAHVGGMIDTPRRLGASGWSTGSWLPTSCSLNANQALRTILDNGPLAVRRASQVVDDKRSDPRRCPAIGSRALRGIGRNRRFQGGNGGVFGEAKGDLFRRADGCNSPLANDYFSPLARANCGSGIPESSRSRPDPPRGGRSSWGPTRTARPTSSRRSGTPSSSARSGARRTVRSPRSARPASGSRRPSPRRAAPGPPT